MGQVKIDKANEFARAGVERVLISSLHRRHAEFNIDEYTATVLAKFGDGQMRRATHLLPEPIEVLRRDEMLGKLYELFANSEPDDDVPDKILDLFFGAEDAST